MNKHVVLKPRLSEKAYGLSEQRNTYVFEVSPGNNSLSVAVAVAKQYDVGVKKVRMAAAAPKNKRSYQRGGRVVHKSEIHGFRKAYVTLNDGEQLPFFAAVEDNKAKAPEKGKK